MLPKIAVNVSLISVLFLLSDSEAVKASMEARKTIKEKTMTNEHHLDPKDEKIISYVSEKAPRPIIGLQDEKGGLDLTDRDQPYWRDAPKKKEK